MEDWVQAAARLKAGNQGFVVVTVLEVKGSAPRSAATKMVVAEAECYDSIGGGNLEFQAINRARTLLRSGQATIERQAFILGQDLTQCCGGQVELLFECFPACDFRIMLFGAGHVGKALVTILSGLPCRVTWFDSRAEVVEAAKQQCQDFGNVNAQHYNQPLLTVEQSPQGCYYLIMTHSHELDFELCEAILARNEVAFCGLIGSRTKAAKFRSRLQRKGFGEAETDRLTCPIGLDLGQGKRPMEVAVSVAAQLLERHYAATTAGMR